MRRLVTALLLQVLVLALLVAPAQAGVKWCDDDPIVRLNGTLVQILVAVPEEYVPLVNGKVSVEIQTPKGTKREVVYTEDGFNGYGETVSFSDLKGARSSWGKIPVQVIVRVPVNRSTLADGEDVPVRVRVIEQGEKAVVRYGTSDLTTSKLSVRSSN